MPEAGKLDWIVLRGDVLDDGDILLFEKLPIDKRCRRQDLAQGVRVMLQRALANSVSRHSPPLFV